MTLRRRRCANCGGSFYSDEFTPTCSPCSGEVFDTTEQDQKDAEAIASVTDVRKLGKRKQTVDIMAIAKGQDEDNG